MKEQINLDNKPRINKTFQLQIDTIRSAAEDFEKVESLILQPTTAAYAFLVSSGWKVSFKSHSLPLRLRSSSNVMYSIL